MNGRLLIVTALVVLVISGLFAGLFSGSIERTLMVPEPKPAKPTVAIKQPAKVQTTPTMPGQMPTAPIAQDTFQRKNQNLWGISSDTNRWSGDANNPNDQTIFSIVNQSGEIANGQGAFNALLGPSTADADVTMSAQISAFTGGTNLGVVIRWQDTNNWYKALIDGTHLRVIRNLQGTTVTLSTVPFSAQGGVLYDLRFRALGAMLLAKAWAAGTQQPTAWMVVTTDNAINTGQSGIRVVTLADTIVTVKSFQDTAANANMD